MVRLLPLRGSRARVDESPDDAAAAAQGDRHLHRECGLGEGSGSVRGRNPFGEPDFTKKREKVKCVRGAKFFCRGGGWGGGSRAKNCIKKKYTLYNCKKIV